MLAVLLSLATVVVARTPTDFTPSEMESCAYLDAHHFIQCVKMLRRKDDIQREILQYVGNVWRGPRIVNYSDPSLRETLIQNGFTADGERRRDSHREHYSTVFKPEHSRVGGESRFVFQAAPGRRYTKLTARLSFRLSPVALAGRYRYKIQLFRFIDSDKLASEPVLTLHRNRAEFDFDGSDTLIVSDIVERWILEPESNYGIALRVIDAEYNDVLDEKTVVLEVEVEQEKRKKRSEGQCAGDDRRCCRHSMEIEFKDFGWDWIVAPLKYNAYYCGGNCEMGISGTKSSYQKILEQTKPHSGQCCAPERLEDLKTIFVDSEGKVQIRDIPSMIVGRCGCI